MSRAYALSIVLCPRRSDGGPDWKDEAPGDYLVRLATRRGLPYPQALLAARRMRRESRG